MWLLEILSPGSWKIVIAVILLGTGWQANTIWTVYRHQDAIIDTVKSDNMASKDLEDDFAKERQKVLTLNQQLEALNAKTTDCRADTSFIRLRATATGYNPATR